MPSGPAHADAASEPGDPLPAPDWMSAAEWEAWCDATAPGDEPPAFGEDEEPGPEPGAWIGQVSGFAAGNLLDALPGGGTLAFFAEGAAGDGDRYAGVSDDELDGVISAWGRQGGDGRGRKQAGGGGGLPRGGRPGAPAR